MIYYHTRAKIQDSVVCQIAWVGSDNKPISVKNVTMTIFKYSGVVRSILSGDVAMQQTDQTHRYVSRYVIPNDAVGLTLYVEYKAQLTADDSFVYGEQTISVDPVTVAGSTDPSNIISVV
jgi:hypothetical protein